MQFIRASRDAILKPLATVAGIVERRHTLPILANVLLRKDGEQVSFLATDVEIQIQTTASLGAGKDAAATTVSARKLIDILRALPEGPEVSISVANRKATIQAGKSRFALQTLGAGKDAAATTVSARKLIDILRALPEGPEVSIAVSNKKATIQAGKSRFALQTLGAEEFPTVAVNEHFSASFALPQKQLKHLFQMVHFAMAQQDIRYYLNGLLMVTDGSVVRVVATDGHRLAYCQAEIDGEPLARNEVIVPRKTVLELQRLLSDGDDPVTIDVAANQVRFRFSDVEMVSKLVEGKFPDYQRVIPSGYRKAATISREALASSLARASILTSDKFRGVRLSLSPGTLKIQTSNAEQEEAVEELEIAYDSEALEIGFNVGYLQDVLGNLRSEQVQMEFGDSNSSTLLTVPGDTSFRYVVMPMRI